MKAITQRQNLKSGFTLYPDTLECIDAPAPRSGQTQSGYGNRLPMPYKVMYLGKWRRVYAICYSNCATLYIRDNEAQNGRVIIDIEKD